MKGGDINVVHNLITIKALLKCEVCGNEQTIRRKASKKKKRGHIKHLWCVKCNKKTPHVEIGVE